MKISKANILKYVAMGIIAACITTFFLKKEKKHGHPRDYAEIATEKIIRAATEYNSISFYVDGDTLSGFHYELIEAFARDHGWKAAITPEMSFDKRLEGLADGVFDVIAYGILATSELKDSLLLTTPIVLNKQILVQRKATSPTDSIFVKSQLDLAGKTLHVVKGSPSILRIHNLGNEIGDTIYIKEIDKYGSEQLIAGTQNDTETMPRTMDAIAVRIVALFISNPSFQYKTGRSPFNRQSDNRHPVP